MRFQFLLFVLAAPFLPLSLYSQSSPVHVAGSVISRDLAQNGGKPLSLDGAMRSSFDGLQSEGNSLHAMALLQCSAPAGSTPGTIISRPMPQYHDGERVSGESVFRVVIGRDGSVKEATELAGPAARKDADLRAVLQWKFEPSRLHGEPIEVSTSISLDAEFDATN